MPIVTSKESERPTGFPKAFWLGVIFAIGFVLFGGVIGGVVGWQMHPEPPPKPDVSEAGGTKAGAGPWGELDYVPFVISAPDEALPVQSIEAAGTHWFFKGYTQDDLEKLVRASDISDKTRAELMDPALWHSSADGIEINVPADLVLALEPGVRKRIYKVLASFPENRQEIYFIHKGTLHDRFGGGTVSEDAMRMFRNLSCEHGDYLVFGGLAAMLGELSSPEEKLGFLKGITKQKTLLLRIHLTPESDAAALAGYWGKGNRGTNMQTLMESLCQVPGGTWLNIVTLMPPLPASRFYSYPAALEHSPVGGTRPLDCHWTTFNFFRGPNELEIDGAYVLRELSSQYEEIKGEPRYGDVVLFAKLDGEIIHSSIYLADDIVFTKNGASSITPWMLATLKDLVEHYSFMVPEGRQLSVKYYRRKGD